MSTQSLCVCVRACMRACMRACVCVEFTFVIKYVNDVNVCATCSCSVIFITGCAQHMNVKPPVGGVLGGGGEATQYFIVHENKPLFKK